MYLSWWSSWTWNWYKWNHLLEDGCRLQPCQTVVEMHLTSSRRNKLCVTFKWSLLTTSLSCNTHTSLLAGWFSHPVSLSDVEQEQRALAEELLTSLFTSKVRSLFLFFHPCSIREPVSKKRPGVFSDLPPSPARANQVSFHKNLQWKSPPHVPVFRLSGWKIINQKGALTAPGELWSKNVFVYTVRKSTLWEREEKMKSESLVAFGLLSHYLDH